MNDASKGPVFYRGRGERGERGLVLPVVDPDALRSPEGYLAGTELAAAVDVALTLGMPLLLTGEPGCGKSRLAYSLAWELHLDTPLEFAVKSDTQGTDLFYTFDTVGRFHASQSESADTDPARFINLNALGRAILYARREQYAVDVLGLPKARVGHPGEPRRVVVLIDEIDKAPRDVPNDILTEIENMRFRIPELEQAKGSVVEVALQDEAAAQDPAAEKNRFRPIVIITSNSERALPDAFLRRCVYYHLPFPDYAGDVDGAGQGVTVEEIVDRRLGHRFAGDGGAFLRSALGLFRFLRDSRQGLERPPALAELLNWLDFLLPRPGEPLPDSLDTVNNERLRLSLKTILLKKETDQLQAGTLLDNWRETTRR